MEVTHFTSRTAAADIDTLAICPAFPDFFIYGTYSIVKRAEDQEYSAQVRTGSIQTLSVSPAFNPLYPGELPPKLAQQSFPAAVLDIKFHSSDSNLLGVALSNGNMHFFRFFKRADVLGRCVVTELIPLGHVEVGSIDAESGIIPLVTQFEWLPSILEVGRRDVSNTLTITLAATLSSGEVKILKTKIPAIKSTYDQRLARPPKLRKSVTRDIHTHTLEAWCTAFVQLPNPNPPSCPSHLLLSGGDDSTLLASIFTLNSSSHVEHEDLFTDYPTESWRDTKSHTAGVTSILPLSAPHDDTYTIPILTGSYDEHIRLSTLSLSTFRRTPHRDQDLSLRGGVWRLQLMDTYTLPLAPDRPGFKAGKNRFTQHYIVLASCMHAGAKIIRLTYAERVGWEMAVEAEFKKGHETLVYACDFVREWRGDVVMVNMSPKSKKVLGVKDGESDMKKGYGTKASEDVGRYTVVSTSFYDRKICNWEWRDERRREAGS